MARGIKCNHPDDRIYKNPNYRTTHGVVKAIRAKPCEICGATKNIQIDHCHLTGKIRGGLCRSCNILLGWIEKHKSKLKKVFAYIKKHK